ncbi:MAG: type II toxin-antitoxin system Phd/YefM family antitoxin [Fidelibacterota bacterium]
MTSIAVSDLRANLMKVLEQIKKGAQIQITSHGKVVAKLVPADQSQSTAQKELLEIGNTAILGDIVAPIDETWEAVSE